MFFKAFLLFSKTDFIVDYLYQRCFIGFPVTIKINRSLRESEIENLDEKFIKKR